MRRCERIGNDLLRLEKFVNLNYTGRPAFTTIIRTTRPLLRSFVLTIIRSRYSPAAAGGVSRKLAGFRKLLKKHDKFAGVQFLPMCALATHTQTL